jgi:hypothetical protein
MAVPTFTVGVELTNGSGTYTDISAYVISWVVQNGFAKAYEPLGRDSTATLVLRNSDKRFSPESGSVFSTSWTRGKRIKINTISPDSTNKQRYIGWIKSIKPAPGVKGPRTCVVQCTSFFDRVQGYDSYAKVQISKTADVVLGVLTANGAVYPPGMPGRWVLGISGMSELGQKTTLGTASDWLTADVGNTTFGYIGDNWGAGVSEYGALRDIAGREGGRLFIDRNGLLVFWNRKHLINITTSSATFTGQTSLTYNYGESLYNRATVRYRTRKVGAAPEVLSRIDRYIQIPQGQSVTVDFIFTDLSASGAKIGGMNVITPVANTDYKINSATDGSGTDYTGFVTVSFVKETGNGAQISFSNPASNGRDLYLQSGATLRGTAIRDFGTQQITQDNAASISLYGLNPHTYPYEMDNANDAWGMAQYVVAFRAVAGQVETVNVGAMRTAALMNTCLSLEIGNAITLTESQTGVNAARYFIIGERHQYGPGKVYDITWTVEPASAYAFWTLGSSTLGQTTVLGPY